MDCQCRSSLAVSRFFTRRVAAQQQGPATSLLKLSQHTLRLRSGHLREANLQARAARPIEQASPDSFGDEVESRARGFWCFEGFDGLVGEAT